MHALRLIPLLLAASLFTTACQTDYKPSRSEISLKTIPPDDVQVELARSAWVTLSDPSQKKNWPAATEQYNKATRVIFQRIRAENFMTEGHFDFNKERPFVIRRAIHVGDRNPGIYEDAIPCDKIRTNNIMEEKVFVHGVGLPIAGIVRKPQCDTRGECDEILKDRGNVHTLTAILDFGSTPSAKPIFRVIPRLNTETIRIGKVEQPLAADFTAPIALFWEKTNLASTALLGAFRPKKTMTYSGLYFSEPYNPDKIPVLLTHGLMSSPDTFSNLVNRLLVDSDIRKNYQFWYFSYPSGIPWPQSAHRQRMAMQAAAKEYDPSGTSRTFNNMVMVGHSMGGLITRYNNATRPWAMIPRLVKGQERLAGMTYDQLTKETIGTPEATKTLREKFIFTPYSQTSRIVFLATPHKGSSFADTWIGLLGEKLIRLPESILMEVTRIATLSSDMLLLNPKDLQREFTSIHQLSPSSPLIQGIQTMRPEKNIPVHSVVGNKGWRALFRSTDGVVPYWSSHLDWSNTEKVVRSGHSVQESIDTALELRAILKEHLRQLRIKESQQFRAPTIWQINPPPRIVLPGYTGE